MALSQIECPQLGTVSLACRTVADCGLSDSGGHCDVMALACRTVADPGLSDSGGPWLVGQWRTL